MAKRSTLGRVGSSGFAVIKILHLKKYVEDEEPEPEGMHESCSRTPEARPPT